VSRREQIVLTAAEQSELLNAERVVVVASMGTRGWPHLMPLWYVPRDGEVWIYTYGKSQKVRNLERDPRATLLIETGHEYSELRGVQIEATAEIHRDIETVFGLAKELTLRYADGFTSIEGDMATALELGPSQARRDLLRRAAVRDQVCGSARSRRFSTLVKRHVPDSGFAPC
jgi:PPOX class probable F420-dependent enzyme